MRHPVRPQIKGIEVRSAVNESLVLGPQKVAVREPDIDSSPVDERGPRLRSPERFVGRRRENQSPSAKQPERHNAVHGISEYIGSGGLVCRRLDSSFAARSWRRSSM